MPPCPAPQSSYSSETIEVPASNGSKSTPWEVPRRSRKVPFRRLHWELNLYSAIFLAATYYVLSPQYKAYMRFILGLICIDASRYYYLKGSMAGVPYTLPLMTVFAMLVFPDRFWAEMADIAMASEDGLCTNSLVGKFLIFVTDPKACRQILTGEGTYGIYAHPNAKWLFGEKNLIYLDKEPHKEVRKVLSPALFSAEALQQYAGCQEMVIRKYLGKYAKQCAEGNTTVDLRIAFRSMAAAASQESFLGPYLNDDTRVHLEEDILAFTMGFLGPPITFIGRLKTAIEAKNRIEATVRNIVPTAREYIAAGNEPRCLLERWQKDISDKAKELGVDPQQVPCCEDDDVARCVLDFLFAAQDATNSALTYGADILDSRHDVMEKMLVEVESVLGKEGSGLADKIGDTSLFPYISRVANQILHHKPPVPMIPHLSKKDSVVNGHNVPAGAILIPSLFYAARVNGVSAEFLPEREDQDSQFVKCMTFGGGQHKCPGRRYAEMLLCVFLGVVATDYRFERVGERPDEDNFIYFPTLFPAENDFKVIARQ
eukprot:Nitzschia sp. Nitz4//scaffold41_size133979//35657//37285//NITZ4_003334-RA/size133979-processed-gene-0.43-mRNA-1//1//CDS//3329551431//7191//frame0